MEIKIKESIMYTILYQSTVLIGREWCSIGIEIKFNFETFDFIYRFSFGKIFGKDYVL